MTMMLFVPLWVEMLWLIGGRSMMALQTIQNLFRLNLNAVLTQLDSLDDESILYILFCYFWKENNNLLRARSLVMVSRKGMTQGALRCDATMRVLLSLTAFVVGLEVGSGPTLVHIHCGYNSCAPFSSSNPQWVHWVSCLYLTSYKLQRART